MYVKYGYKNMAWDVLLFKGRVNGKSLEVPQLDAVDVKNASSVDFQSILTYDRIVHGGIDRSKYWKGCFEKKGAIFLVALKKDAVVGFAGIRPSKTHHVLCPIYADSLDIAKILIKSLIIRSSPDVVKIEGIEPNPNIKELVAWIGIPPSEDATLIRLYTGKEEQLPYDKVYGLAESDVYFV